MASLQPFVRGLAFPESPRWHAGALWFSDFYRQCVQRAREDGTLDTVARLDDQPSGLGWTPDGRLLVVGMTGKRLLRVEGGEGRVVAELGPWAAFCGRVGPVGH